MQTTIDPGNRVHTFLSNKNYGDARGEGLIAPSASLYGLVEDLEKEYRGLVESVMHMNHVMYRLVTGLEKKVSDRPFACSVCCCRLKVINLFVRVRFHQSENW